MRRQRNNRPGKNSRGFEGGIPKVVAGGVTELSFVADPTSVTVNVTTESGDQSTTAYSQVVNAITVTPKN